MTTDNVESFVLIALRHLVLFFNKVAVSAVRNPIFPVRAFLGIFEFYLIDVNEDFGFYAHISEAWDIHLSNRSRAATQSRHTRKSRPLGAKDPRNSAVPGH